MENVAMFCCSGGSDTGEIADRAVRSVRNTGAAKMYCTAAIAVESEKAMELARAASRIIVVDGCDNDCARKIIERAGYVPAVHIRLPDLGMKKFESPVTEERIAIVAARVTEAL
jgi:uncharacterized metal-binding protein